jgi:TRAP-type C4-dicarboxylate transport system substrate-binding protein
MVARGIEEGRRTWMSSRRRPLTLRLATQYASPASVPEAVAFAEGVSAASGGTVRIRLVFGWVGDKEADEERTLVRGVAAGLADLVQVGTRAIGASFGIHDLDPLEAPLLFRDAAGVAAACSVLNEQLTGVLEPSGLVGLAVIAGPLRYPFAFSRPLVRIGHWPGQVIRTHRSVVAAATIRALGAVPVLRAPRDLRTPARAGIDGMDLDLTSLREWAYQGYLTENVPLWPRTLLLAANRQTFERLDADIQALIRTTALRTAEGFAVLPPPSRERQTTASVTAVRASDAELEEFRQRVEQVHEQMRREPRASALYDQLTESQAAARQTTYARSWRTNSRFPTSGIPGGAGEVHLGQKTETAHAPTAEGNASRLGGTPVAST